MRQSPSRPLIATAAIAVAIFVAACGSAAAPVPSELPATPPPSVGAPTLPPPTPDPVTPAPVTPSPAPVEPTPEPTPEPTQPPANPRPPQPTPLPFTEAEKDLLARIRPDVREHCVPRRTDLPNGATAGVECRPSAELVARVGIYKFPNSRAAALAYFDRMAGYGVEPQTGDCVLGRESDGAWTPGDGEPDIVTDPNYGVEYKGKPYSALRAGCFIDEAGNANFRVTCGDGLYVGVLGRTSDIAKLNTWTWKYAAGIPAPTPMPPGICIASA